LIQRYLGKMSGPLLDRIDIHVEVPAVPYQELRGNGASETSAEIRAATLKYERTWDLNNDVTGAGMIVLN
jgi:magnesium chelatase family protein